MSQESGAFGSRVAALDETVDRWFEPLRANEITDRIFYGASALGDFSLIWHVLGAWKGLLPGGHPRDSVRLSTAMGIESLVINQGVKRLFRRVRPARDEVATDRYVRRPITSSFPSGHTSAAMTAAAILGRRSRIGPIYYLIGAVVATSRIHVRMHHASDVVGGVAVGLLMGRAAAKFVGRPKNR